MASNNLLKAQQALNNTISNNNGKNNITGNWQGNTYQRSNGQLSPERITIEMLAKEIKAERLKQGLTQRQLAHMSNYSQGTITRLETRMWTSMICIIRVAQALNKKLTLT